jgi:hypothetical protein
MPNAFIEPTKKEKNYIVSRMPDTDSLDDTAKKEFERAMDSLLISFDTCVRSATINFPQSLGQGHYHAIRALNTPSTPPGYKRNVQLVGQEYFGVNRFFPAFRDIADIEFWGMYEDGDWGLHSWNSHGEHLEVRSGGIGELKTGFLKVNGVYLGPEEVISFIQCFKRRVEGNFKRYYDDKTIRYTISQLEKGQKPLQRRLDQLRALGLIDENHEPTYILESMATDQEATDRKEYDQIIKWLRRGVDSVPSGLDLGPHGISDEIKLFYRQNPIRSLVNTQNPSYDDVQRFLELEKQCLLKFGFSLRDIHLLDWPDLLEYSTLNSSQNTTPNQRKKNTLSAFQKIRRAVGI